MTTQARALPPVTSKPRAPLVRPHAGDPRWTIFWSEAIRNARRANLDQSSDGWRHQSKSRDA